MQWHHCQKEEERSKQTGIAMLHGSTKIRLQPKKKLSELFMETNYSSPIIQQIVSDNNIACLL